jgi:hypothetical protein
MMRRLCTAEASTTEEADAGTLHVRVCTGGPGNRHSYRKGSDYTLHSTKTLKSSVV